ncbi:MerR family DNA-binding transcriptional regulator [Actinoplanes couchii]|uniref:Transcriptional regulator n=1 Tax=Actinoplanes couchii TaxID=403638 RepID=A0ABQ3XNQ3_9ACTN|nr:MerR family transcriptional regulator [Actinoplanes couchii]MDR6319642.1 DNA-binding transcriptional MerR regulator [Actinoplanes couchii]GID60136.1 transcriptional regulator [Actinoplanes couchii]
MSLPFLSPRQVKIGDAAAFAGITPRAIRHYHAIGLLPEPERGSDGRRRYGYEDMIRLLWIRKMADVGIALDDIRAAFSAGQDGDDGIAAILERVEESLAEQEAQVRRRRAAVQRMRTEGSRMGLLSDFVTDRFRHLPEGSLRQADLDSLLVTERMLGPLGAAYQTDRFILLATHPELRAESDRITADEEALDDGVAVDDPRVARVAADWQAFEKTLEAAATEAGLYEDDDMLEAWDALHPPTADDGKREPGSMSLLEAVGKMPYDFSPARRRMYELIQQTY